MSGSPKPPGRSLWKKRRWPSMESLGPASMREVLIGAPRLAGGPHGQSSQSRCDTQMSFAPRPPGRSEVKYRLRPSGESAAFTSFAELLIVGPRLTGGDHSELSNDERCGTAPGRRSDADVTAS